MTLSNESKLLLLLTSAEITKEDIMEADNLLSGEFDWQNFFGKVYYHRVTGIVNEAISHCQFNSWLHKEIKNSIWSSSEMFSLRSEKEIPLIQALSDQLLENDIQHAFLKGVELNYSVYNRPGLRISTDVDLLVHPDCISSLSKLMNQMGYVQGDYDYRKKVVPVDRQTKLMHQMGSHELYPYIKIINEPGLDVQILDVHHSIQLGEGVGNHNKQYVTDILNRAVYHEETRPRFMSLSPEDSLVFLCNHLAKDAVSELYKQRGMNLQLYKFCDVHHYIKRKQINWDFVFDIANQLGLRWEVEFALYYTEELYPGTLPLTIEWNHKFNSGWVAPRLFKEEKGSGCEFD